MDVNQETVDLIKGFEGWRAKAYRDAVGVLFLVAHPPLHGGTQHVAGRGVAAGFDLLLVHLPDAQAGQAHHRRHGEDHGGRIQCLA